MKEEKQPKPIVTPEAPREITEKPKRLRVEELEARVAPQAIWSD